MLFSEMLVFIYDPRGDPNRFDGAGAKGSLPVEIDGKRASARHGDRHNVLQTLEVIHFDQAHPDATGNSAYDRGV
jgi:hypothetical protein